MITVTIGDLKDAIRDLPTDAQIIVEYGSTKFEVDRVFAIGAKTLDPGLVLKLR